MKRNTRAPRPVPSGRIERLEGRTLMAASAFDGTFGIGGKSKHDISGLADGFAAVHALPDGKLLVAGSSSFGITGSPFAGPPSNNGLPVERETAGILMRLNPDGTPDLTFDADGVAEFPSDPAAYVPWRERQFHPRIDNIAAIAVQGDGRILVGGTGYRYHAPAPHLPQTLEDGTPILVLDHAFAVARYNTDGTVDRTFGAGGVAVADLIDSSQGFLEWVQALAIAPDGKIVAAGGVSKDEGPEGSTDMGVVRLNADGSQDDTFSRRLVDFPGRQRGDVANAVVIQSDGKLVLGGATGSRDDGAPHGFGLARLNPDGSTDTSFGDGGFVITQFPMSPDPIHLFGQSDGGSAQTLALRPDGKIVAVGQVANVNLAIAQYNPDGSRDASFGSNGLIVTRGVLEGQYDVTIAPDGTLTVHGAGNGYYYERTPTSAIPRHTGMEVFVGRFSDAGVILSSARAERQPMTGDERVAVMPSAVAVQADGKIVAVGGANPTFWDVTAHLNDPDAHAASEVHGHLTDALAVRFDPALLTPDPAAGRAEGGAGGGSGAVSMANNLQVRSGRSAKLRLFFASAEAARAASVTVSGPNGFTAGAQLLKVKAKRGGVAVATFLVAAPGGSFDSEDNGTYTVRLAGADAEAPPVGQFMVTVAPKKARRGARPLVRLQV